MFVIIIVIIILFLCTCLYCRRDDGWRLIIINNCGFSNLQLANTKLPMKYNYI